MIVAVIVNTCF